MSELNPDELHKLKVENLRKHLSSRGLSTAGLKAELVQRLKTNLLNEEPVVIKSEDSQTHDEKDEVNVKSEFNISKDIDSMNTNEPSMEESKLKTELNSEKEAEKEKQEEMSEKKQSEEEQLAHEEQRKINEEEMRKEQEQLLVKEQMRQAQEDHKRRLKADEEKRKFQIESRSSVTEMAEELKFKSENEQILIQDKSQKRSEYNSTQLTTETDLSQREQVFFPSAITTHSMPMQMPLVNILHPPPAIFMSNIPPLLPPGTSLPQNTLSSTMENISASSAIFPPPFPPISILKSQENNQDSLLNNFQQNNLPEYQIISEEEAMETLEENSSEIKLPQAIEKVLALKTERAQLLGVDPEFALKNLPVNEEKDSSSKNPSNVTLVSVDEDENADDSSKTNKESKNKKRKKKKKKRQPKSSNSSVSSMHSEKQAHKGSSIDVDIDYVQEVMDISDPLYLTFMHIFEKFKLSENEKENEGSSANMNETAKEEMVNPMALRKKPVDLDDDDDDDEENDDKLEDEKPKLSKKKLKKLSRMTVAELKQKVSRPELVEMHDVTAKDPVLLLHLKASRNTVPVPRHWCFKRKYLQGKRGIEKPAFQLPDFIKKTGIMEMREALLEKEDQKTMKAKMREKARPKLGKIDIDYQKLHDAFFKWQTKPKMTIHGDLYYEGKEFETRLKEKKPGDLSEDLRTALGMPTGLNAKKCPPPWLIAMQRYGPPPSYPNLKISGLNAPIPDGCSFGYHAGGWGKPPVDESGRPLYGDVFGSQAPYNEPHIQEEEIDHTLWGELESESSEEDEDYDEEEEEEEEEKEKAEDETGLVTPAEGIITPSGFSSIPAGMETPDLIELRKRKIEAEMEGGETPALYTILPEKRNERIGAAMMGSTHIYDIAAAIPGSKLKAAGTASVAPQGIEVALDPSELEMDSAAMAARYEQTMREQQSMLAKEDLSDMVAEHAARQRNKRKKQQLDSAKPPKKYKEFKF